MVSTKKRAITIDSSDDEVIAASPAEVKKKVITKTKKRKIIDSDSDDENKTVKANKASIRDEKHSLKKVNAADVFGSTPVKQAKLEKKDRGAEKDVKTYSDNKKNKHNAKTHPKLETELGIHDDPEFEQSLLELDNDLLLDNVSVLDKTIEEALSNANNSMSSNKTTEATPNRKRKVKDEEEDDSGIDKDQERYEKRRHSALLYHKYLNRSGPAHHGTKEYPKV